MITKSNDYERAVIFSTAKFGISHFSKFGISSGLTVVIIVYCILIQWSKCSNFYYYRLKNACTGCLRNWSEVLECCP